MLIHAMFEDNLEAQLFVDSATQPKAGMIAYKNRFVFGGDRENAVGINVEDDFDLRHAARSRRDAVQVELAKRAGVLRHAQAWRPPGRAQQVWGQTPESGKRRGFTRLRHATRRPVNSWNKDTTIIGTG